MIVNSLIFAFVFAIPLVGFIFYLIWKDKQKRNLGIAVLIILLVFAVLVAYQANKDKGI
ncbi:hypothetical protein ADIARSV_3940 [Arcticibacter svalbardensis MN12-7]|uniref:Uncharacterized protein n=1 Tax=Arcticibacter svalbardensis MN12-7 TaxID=1150600 RepID=R9GLZ0_9SPHI|nr:hypothetical protein [Arcticibacter svalbardensis]EOR92852.1 hypothetical protein ADIARSV_3940 [Arcticibacter svalbardensis MN12-7]